jgi:hypothetical protein
MIDLFHFDHFLLFQNFKCFPLIISFISGKFDSSKGPYIDN